jgi:hypothetical protein
VSNDPVLIAYAVKRNSKTKRAIWTRIGCAYPHDVGAGLTVVLDSVPLDGRIVLLELDAADNRRIISDAALTKSTTRAPSPSKRKSKVK